MKHLSLFCLLLLFSCNNNTPNASSRPSSSTNEPKEELILIDSSFTDTAFTKKENSQQSIIGNNANYSSLPKIAPQQFTIKSNQDTIVIGKKGSVFLIPKNSFINKQGEAVTGKINLVLIEAYELEDILLNNLQTISDEGLLITSGMFSLTATDEAGEQLQIAKDKSIYFQTKNKVSPKDKLYTLENSIWTTPTPPTNYLTYKPFDFYPTKTAKDECYALLKVHISNMLDSNAQKNKLPKSFIFSKEFFERYQDLVCYGYTDIALKYLENYQLNLVEADKKVLDYIKKRMNTSDKKSTIIQKIEQYISQNKTTFPPNFTYPSIDYKHLFPKAQNSRLSAINYSIRSLGWCNIDRVYPNDKLQQQTIQVKTNQPLKFLYLIGKNQAISFSATSIAHSPPYEHTFHVKLPIGVEFYLLAANEQNSSVNYAQKLITTSGNSEETLTLKPIKSSTFSNAMQDIQANWQVAK